MLIFTDEYKRTIFPRIMRAVGVASLDVVAMILCALAALWVRFDFSVYATLQTGYVESMLSYLPIYIATFIVMYYVFRLYHSIWRYAGVMEVIRAVGCYIFLVPVIYFETLILQIHLPRSFFFITFIMDFVCCVGIRLSYRVVRLYFSRFRGHSDNDERIMVIGGGAAGRNIIKEIQLSDEVGGSICCVIDDNANKWRRSLEGVPVVGGRYDIPAMVEKYGINRIIYAIPSAEPKDRSEILNIAKETGASLKAIPAIYQLLNGEVSVSSLRDVDITDLLGRDEIHVNNDEILSHISGRVVMVTGGGGSIGSELCRQIAASDPKQLIIFDIYENNAYAIQQELVREYPQLDLVTLIGSVRNTNRVNYVLEKYKPDMIYHAAAHKHVP
nr:polysaccharide biosynthesis protein [Lachnospiraceae bacterium]